MGNEFYGHEVEYAGFWIRVGATLIDTLLIMVITSPILVYGWSYFGSDKMIAGPADFLISWIFPAAAVVWFWIKRQATQRGCEPVHFPQA